MKGWVQAISCQIQWEPQLGRKIARLEETIQQLPSEVSDLQWANQEKDSLNKTIESLCECVHCQCHPQATCIHHVDSKMTDLEETTGPASATLKETIRYLHPLDIKIARLEETIKELVTQLADSQHNAGSLLRAHEQKHQYELLNPAVA